MTSRGSRPSSGGRDGGRLLDPAAEGVDVVPQECPVGAHDQHVDDVEADQHFAVGRVNREPGSRRNLRVATLDGYPSRHDGFQEHTACRAYDRRIAHARGREVRMERSTSPYAWRGRRGTTRRSSSRSSASAPPKRQHVPQAGREGAGDTLRGHRKARNRVRQREHGKVSKRAHHVGRRSALAARPAAISVLHTFDRSKV